MLCKSSLEASPLSCTCCHHIFLTIVACDVSVSFLNVCYVGFGPVFFCTYEECKALINLSGSPQGHPRFDILATPCGMAHGRSTHAKALTLLEFYRRTHPSSSVELIHHRAIYAPTVFTRPQARTDVPVCVRAPMCPCVCALRESSRSLVYTRPSS